MHRRGRALVVLDGVERLRWSGHGPVWRLAGAWPDAADLRTVRGQIDCGEPLLVVLDRERPTVTAFVEEVPVPPPSVDVVTDDGGLVELHVQQLDWLPDGLRSRGEAFALRAAHVERVTPLAELPPLLVEPGPEASPPVVFARRTRVCRVLTDAIIDSALEAVAGRLTGLPRAC